MTNIIQIKGLLPGSGKTNTLVRLFQADLYNETYKYIVAYSNKAVQECRKRLVELYPDIYNEKLDYLNKHVISFRKFKKNYISLLKEGTELEYFTIHSKDNISRQPYHIYLDEDSFITEEEGNDLLQHFWIRNLIIAGDTLQHKPQGEKWAQFYDNNEFIISKEGIPLYMLDEGKECKFNTNFQVCLNKQLRASDPDLVEVLRLIKEGHVIDALKQCKAPLNPIYIPTDWHIMYTNERCNKYNNMYLKEYHIKGRWIVDRTDNDLGFYKGEIYNETDEIFLYKKEQFKIKCLKKSSNKSFEEDWKCYLQYIFKPAYALTSHKLQGSKIETGDIFIHLDDAYSAVQNIEDLNERVNCFQRFLYVALSRAVSLNQINIMGDFDIYDLETTTFGKQLKKYCEMTVKLIDDTIKKDAIYRSAKDDDLIEIILSHYDTSDCKDSPVYQRIKEHISKSHSVEHKEHSNKKFTDEYLLNIDWEELKSQTKNTNILSKWKKLHKSQ